MASCSLLFPTHLHSPSEIPPSALTSPAGTSPTSPEARAQHQSLGVTARLTPKDLTTHVSQDEVGTERLLDGPWSPSRKDPPEAVCVGQRQRPRPGILCLCNQKASNLETHKAHTQGVARVSTQLHAARMSPGHRSPSFAMSETSLSPRAGSLLVPGGPGKPSSALSWFPSFPWVQLLSFNVGASWADILKVIL